MASGSTTTPILGWSGSALRRSGTAGRAAVGYLSPRARLYSEGCERVQMSYGHRSCTSGSSRGPPSPDGAHLNLPSSAH